MPHPARQIAPALHRYKGGATDPARWACWTPRAGDILVCTPPKSGTTWTQTILAMLVHGGPDLPAPVPVLSPWIDADLGVPAPEVAANVAAQTGRRVLKTHTPADGFPVWEGVTVVAVYRHPLDVFFSLRKHIANQAHIFEEDAPYRASVQEAFRHFVTAEIERTAFGFDSLAKFAMQYTGTACSDRVPGLIRMHYADMLRDGRGAVARLAAAIGIDDPALVDRVTDATGFAAMKSKAAEYVPVAGTGFFHSDAGFFDSATSHKWEGQLSDAEVAQFEARLAELVPDDAQRAWFKHGDAALA